MTVTTEHAVVAAAVTLAALWLVRRAWVRARDRYRSGPCCGDGCGCVKPMLFGPKKDGAPRTPEKRRSPR